MMTSKRRKKEKGKSRYDLVVLFTDVTWNSENESLATSEAGQPRGDCPYKIYIVVVGAVQQGAALDFCYYRKSA
jgi:hypothetical protein